MGSVNLPGGDGGGQDFELNLAPIIDCLVVLITFMLASATFLSIGILDAGISAGGATTTATTPPSIVVTVELKKDFQMQLRVEGKETLTVPIGSSAPANAGATSQWNMPELVQKIRGLRQKYADFGALTIQGDNQLEYREFVTVMDSLRKEIPVVMLGGF